MNIKKIFTAVAGMSFLVGAVALPAFAQTAGIGIGANASGSVDAGGAHVGVSARANLRATIIAKAETRADQEITRRINMLNALMTRVNAMVLLSSDEKNSLSSTIQGQITLMNDLQTQIATDASANSTSSLKSDIQSIVKSYRIFILIVPQGAIAAAADRIETIASLMNDLSAMLQVRITDAGTAGDNTTAAAAALADMNAKIADANVQAAAAVTETASLKPDNGDQTVMASNRAALQDARSKIVAAQKDLGAARKDAGMIVKDLMSFRTSASASASSTITASTTP